MGKTMASLLSCIPPDHMAQLYIHSEVPTTGNSDRYFRITDRDVLRSIFTRRPGFHIYSREDIDVSRVNPRTDSGAAARIYQFSRRRTAPIYFMRNALWRIGIWKSKALYEWIEDFSPDVIFFASGDYSFSYRITYEISRKYQLPVVMWCCDDFYFSRRFRGGLTSRLYHKGMMGWIRRLKDRKRRRDFNRSVGQPQNGRVVGRITPVQVPKDQVSQSPAAPAAKPVDRDQRKAFHRCAVCGITELDDPNMTFRYCSQCNGNYEYCERHIHNHVHVK